MSLTIKDLELIAQNIAESKGVEDYEFEHLKNEVTKILKEKNVSFANGEKQIRSLQQLSTNFCQHISDFSNNSLINKLNFDFKKEVSLILKIEKIEELGELLSRIENLESWNPTLLISIGRKKVRGNDVINRYQELYNDEEKRKIMSIYQWIKTNIKTEDGNSVDWESVLEKLKEAGYEDLANKFTTQK